VKCHSSLVHCGMYIREVIENLTELLDPVIIWTHLLARLIIFEVNKSKCMQTSVTFNDLSRMECNIAN
jgi:hypothetical protein